MSEHAPSDRAQRIRVVEGIARDDEAVTEQDVWEEAEEEEEEAGERAHVRAPLTPAALPLCLVHQHRRWTMDNGRWAIVWFLLSIVHRLSSNLLRRRFSLNDSV